jgi:hypothetical protein
MVIWVELKPPKVNFGVLSFVFRGSDELCPFRLVC